MRYRLKTEQGTIKTQRYVQGNLVQKPIALPMAAQLTRGCAGVRIWVLSQWSKTLGELNACERSLQPSDDKEVIGKPPLLGSLHLNSNISFFVLYLIFLFFF